MAVVETRVESTIGATQAAEELQRRRRARGSLYEFCKQSWHVVEGTRPFNDNWHIGAICFPYDAPIITETGPMAIGALVAAKWSGRVLSANHGTGELEWRRVTAHMASPGVPLITLVIDGGHRISLTRNHPVFVSGIGYIRADDVNIGARLIHVDMQTVRRAILPAAVKATRDVLQQPMLQRGALFSWALRVPDLWRHESVGQRQVQAVLGRCESERSGPPLQELWNGCLSLASGLGRFLTDAWRVLQPSMLWPLYHWTPESSLHRWPAAWGVPRRVQDREEACSKAGWARLLSVFQSPALGCPPHRSGWVQQRTVESRCPMPALPQSAERETNDGEGISEAVVIAIEEGVRIPETVYNIEVEGNHNYVADGVLVHNCEHVQAVIQGQIRDLLINQPPRTMKSTTIAVNLVPWAWIDHADLQFLYTAYAQNLTIRDSVKTRRIIESKWYQVRFGNRFQITSDQNTKLRFDNDRSGYRIASSVDGTNTGEGGDILVCDDPNSANDVSKTLLANTSDWWDHTMSSRLNDPMTGRRIVVQQRIHEQDLSGHILAGNTDGEWVHLMLPMEFEVRRRCVTVVLPTTDGKKWQDPRTEEGEYLWKTRFDKKALAKLKKGLRDEYVIAGQLQQRPAPAEGGMIKKKWFQWWKRPEPPVILFALQSWDTAMSEKKKASYSACTTWGVFNDENGIAHVILLSMWRDRVIYPDLRRKAQELFLDYRGIKKLPKDWDERQKLKRDPQLSPEMVLVEAKMSGLALIADLRKAGVMCHRFDPDKFGDKEQRVKLVTHIIEAGRVWMPAVPPLYDRLRPYADIFVEQCGVWPNSESRDLVDTMAQALLRLQLSGWVWHPDDAEQPPPAGTEAADDRPALY